MKQFLAPITVLLPAFLFFSVAALWTLSYQSMHSVRYGRSVGEIRLLWDKGILQVDVVQGDTKNPGFEWDAHRRAASGGRATLNMFKPKAGPGRFFADLGFAQWTYSLYVGGWFSEGHTGLVVFFPFWFVILFPAALFGWQIKAATFAKEQQRASTRDDGAAHWMRSLLGGRLPGGRIRSPDSPATTTQRLQLER